MRMWKGTGCKSGAVRENDGYMKKMQTSLDCLPCLIRQTVSVIRTVCSDPQQQNRLMKSILEQSGSLDFEQPPPVLAKQIHQLIRQKTGKSGLYQQDKQRQNAMAMALLPEMRQRLKTAKDPFELALHLAIAGNVIDLGVQDQISETEILQSLEQALQTPLHGDMGAFRRALDATGTVLYLADNAGEIVFDGLLIEQIGADKVTLVVRGEEILNDVTRDDIQQTGLDSLVEVIDNGSGVPGTMLEDCSEEFRRRFAEADLIISKGQGNYETLSGHPENIFFLFKAKCDVIANRAGVPAGTNVLLH